MSELLWYLAVGICGALVGFFLALLVIAIADSKDE
jgi:hypothetical protein